ncbi:Sodium-dependent nutrient amino acid transporter 1 [Pseudolycoriella hygida]|uniref:Transporter n=1 Tax=Pseudolycoriella hygida TaxID=35572 RepID=A0A9Q0S6N6_9DIPT|nr:Sodium-dependent nutrient amino acid transporter 1 [Pseudolycoriella hygida]
MHNLRTFYFNNSSSISEATLFQQIQVRTILQKEIKRDSWDNGWEFLVSCIALSVGLGNVWRFPFTALENGGGAFLIPYMILLFLVGKPVYYLEMLIGQFSSRGSLEVFDFAPIMRGIGYGQIYAIAITTRYYASILTLIIKYFVASFGNGLPWSYCKKEWGENCIDSARKRFFENEASFNPNGTSSAELYFYKEVLKELPTIDNGIGQPDLTLVVYLVIKSSGKSSYFLAIFPYIVMLILFVRAITLPEALQGISYLFTPQFNQLLNPKVWYSAMIQVFYSLSICFGPIIMHASFNRFSQNILRDVTIVTILDTFTSLLSSVIIFGILGNLAYETGSTDIQSVVQGGSGLAFVSYTYTIAKFELIPQVFSVLFFFMLFVLGIGTNVDMSSCLLHVIRDSFPKHRHWKFILPVALVQFPIGLVYLTPGGQYIMTFVDFFGASFLVICLAIAEILSFGWIYGVNPLCKDIEFMLDVKTGWYWRICWGVISPVIMTAILCLKAITLKPLKYHDYTYTESFYWAGWLIFGIGVIQLPFWAIYTVFKQNDMTIRGVFDI